jgi:drug/metabolite transporter (DMT)-like permease
MSWQLWVGISVFLFSLNGLFHRVLMKEENADAYAQTVAFYGLGGIAAFFIAIFRGGFHYDISLDQLPYFFLLAVFATIAPVCMFQAFKRVQASEISIVSSSQRLWMVLGAFIFLGESMTWQKVVGTLVIVGGILIAQREKKQFVWNEGDPNHSFRVVGHPVSPREK